MLDRWARSSRRGRRRRLRVIRGSRRRCRSRGQGMRSLDCIEQDIINRSCRMRGGRIDGIELPSTFSLFLFQLGLDMRSARLIYRPRVY
uniref:Uncharacterized protein n=1 Tax=Utricularia reniformis TaxID=192314 RepID=A0A1Y0AZ95_9LAMI|nr:hypothetical protein AEK19_MT0182 [Utricularia reniformis]ART30464.1 hypothetical protein AEK19_MT0182 [Utricularia reniformis]